MNRMSQMITRVSRLRVLGSGLMLASLTLAGFVGCGGDSGGTASSPVASVSGPPAPPGPPGPPGGAPAAPAMPGTTPPMPGTVPPMPGTEGSGSPSGEVAAPGPVEPMPMPGTTPMPMPTEGAGGYNPNSDVAPMPMPNVYENGSGSGSPTIPSEQAGSGIAPMPNNYGSPPMPGAEMGPGPGGVPGAPTGPAMRGPFGMVSSMLDGVSGLWKVAELKSAEKQLPAPARLAFMAGDEKEALRQVLAGYLINDSAADSLPSHMKWYSGLSRPAVMVRTGIGVVYTAPNGFTGNPYAVGPRPPETEQPGGADAGNRRNQPNQPQQIPPPAATDPGSSAQTQLNYYTGDLGMQLVAGLDSRIRSGSYGGALRAVMLPLPIPGAGSDPSQQMGPGGSPNYGPMPGPMPGPGSEMAGMSLPPGLAGAAGAKTLLPGVTWLGTGSATELAKTAREMEIDVLIVFEVTVRTARTSEFVQNTTKFRVSTTSNNQTIFSSAQLNNLKVFEERAKSKTADPIADEVKRYFTAADKVLTPANLPSAVTADRVATRVKDLAAKKPDNPLPTLVEIRYYNKLGLLADNAMTEAFSTLLGGEKAAELLKSPSPIEERALALSDWIKPPLPASLPNVNR